MVMWSGRETLAMITATTTYATHATIDLLKFATGHGSAFNERRENPPSIAGMKVRWDAGISGG